MATKRIYKVTTPKGIRLVDAINRAQALAHVVRDEVSVEIATAYDVADLVVAGVKIERLEPGTDDLFQEPVAQELAHEA